MNIKIPMRSVRSALTCKQACYCYLCTRSRGSPYRRQPTSADRKATSRRRLTRLQRELMRLERRRSGNFNDVSTRHNGTVNLHTSNPMGMHFNLHFQTQDILSSTFMINLSYDKSNKTYSVLQPHMVILRHCVYVHNSHAVTF